MDVLLSSGLYDGCIEHCKDLSNNTSLSSSLSSSSSFYDNNDNNHYINNSKSLLDWSIQIDTIFSKCMQSICLATEPTKYNPEWIVDHLDHPLIRLDFILVSKNIITSSSRSSSIGGDSSRSSSSNYFYDTTNKFEFTAGVIRNNVTDVISDHYPVYVNWKEHKSSYNHQHQHHNNQNHRQRKYHQQYDGNIDNNLDGSSRKSIRSSSSIESSTSDHDLQMHEAIELF